MFSNEADGTAVEPTGESFSAASADDIHEGAWKRGEIRKEGEQFWSRLGIRRASDDGSEGAVVVEEEDAIGKVG